LLNLQVIPEQVGGVVLQQGRQVMDMVSFDGTTYRIACPPESPDSEDSHADDFE
jgi:hypothetical protein